MVGEVRLELGARAQLAQRGLRDHEVLVCSDQVVDEGRGIDLAKKPCRLGIAYNRLQAFQVGPEEPGLGALGPRRIVQQLPGQQPRYADHRGVVDRHFIKCRHQLFNRVLQLANTRLEVSQQHGGSTFQHLRIQLFLGREIVQQSLLGQRKLPGDGIDADAVEAPLGKQGLGFL